MQIADANCFAMFFVSQAGRKPLAFELAEVIRSSRSLNITRKSRSSAEVRAPARLRKVTAPEPQPFLKWVGGKGQLLAQFEAYLPSSIGQYCEPFVGGGAVFFRLHHRYPGMSARLCDNNVELINCYTVVRDKVLELMQGLDEHLKRFRIEGETYFYLVRSRHHLTDPLERACRMIFLNKTCFNGLWRVNARGEFNVPIGSYDAQKLSLYDRDNLLRASSALQTTELVVQDFRDTIQQSKPGGFMYIDPPYFPVSATANFTSYTKEEFGKAEQEELAALCADAARRGVSWMLSNSDTPFIRSLYKQFPTITVKARRAVNSDGAKRGHISEVLVLSSPRASNHI